jgi:hypothetical protein
LLQALLITMSSYREKRGNKRQKQGHTQDDEDGKLPSFHQHDGISRNPFETEEIRDLIFSFLQSPEDLCTLDLVNEAFRASAKPLWEKLAFAKYGVSTGKAGWRQCTSLLKQPDVIELQGIEGFAGGRPRLATNQSIVVSVKPDMESGIGIWNAYSLNYCRTASAPTPNDSVAICGRKGAEVIVTLDWWRGRLVAQQDDTVQQIRFLNDKQPTSCVLGCETHLIVGTTEKILLYEVKNAGNLLLGYINSIPIVQGGDPKSRIGLRNELCWSPDELHFALYYEGSLSIWSFDRQSGKICQLLLKENMPSFQNVKLTDHFVVASCEDRIIHVYDRKTLDKINTL